MEDPIHYRPIKHNECEKIREINASQYIGKAWRKIDGTLRLVSINYLDPDFPEGFEKHLCRLQQTVKTGGVAIGAFHSAGRMIGFSALNLSPFGTQYRYVLLDQLFVSAEFRGKGIGKNLFLLTAAEAEKNSMQKLYICAGSSEETVAFYRSLGCVDALEINPELLDHDPRDLQLEFSL